MRRYLLDPLEWLFTSNTGGWILVLFAAAVILTIIVGLIDAYITFHEAVIRWL